MDFSNGKDDSGINATESDSCEPCNSSSHYEPSGSNEIDNSAARLGDDLDLSDSREDDSSDSDSESSSSNTEEDEVETKRKTAGLSEDFIKPMNEGWQRECIMREGRVSKVYYLTPITKEMNRRRVRNKKKLKSFLSSKSDLSQRHFNFDLKRLEVEGEMEVIKEAQAETCFTYETKAVYNFWNEVDHGIDRRLKSVSRRKGKCSLCPPDTQVEITRYNFTNHMLIFHLPDETCEICGKDVPAEVFRHHWEICDADETKAALREKMLQFWVEVLSDKNRVKRLEGRLYMKRGRCLLCPGHPNILIPLEKFHLHMETWHLPAEPCTECGHHVLPRNRNKHLKECSGKDECAVEPSVKEEVIDVSEVGE